MVILLYVVKLFASRASSSCKHDMGALSWLNAETLERVHFLGRFVRCSAHGHSFMQYSSNLLLLGIPGLSP